MSTCWNADVTLPLVSVVVPVYNKAQFLPDALRSFERQTYENVEWVIVDDGSEDESGEICRSWRPGRGAVCFLQKSNGGASSARNEGFRHARGEYILFWDADDVQDPSAIEKMTRAALDNRADVVVSAIKRIDLNGAERCLFTCDVHKTNSEDALLEWLYGRVSTGPCTKLVRKSLLIDRAICFEEGIINEDAMWTAEVLGSAKTVLFLGEPLYHYISRPESVTMAAADMRLMDVFDNCEKLEHYIEEAYPRIVGACRDYCASICWNVILTTSRGNVRKLYPELHSRGIEEYNKRKDDIKRCRHSLKDRALQFLIKLHLYHII